MKESLLTYQKSGRYFAQIAGGLEELAERELREFGAYEIKPGHMGFYFSADKAALYRINYRARILTRILAPLIRFDCHSDNYLYKTACRIDWPALFDLEKTFAVKANVSHSRITHSQYAALRLKDAVVDVFRKKTGRRPSVDTKTPDILLNLYIQGNKATVYLDTSGGSLHRRGYRSESVAAPMQEIVAAAVISLSNWDGSRPLVDPMCGSGTLICEALMRHCQVPAGFLRRKFGFEALPDFDPRIWASVKKEADGSITELPDGLISGSDQSAEAIAAARANLNSLPSGRNIKLTVSPFQKLAALENSVILCNPPYGIRMDAESIAKDLMKQFGDFLKNRCKGSEAYLYFGNRELIKHIGLKPTWKKILLSGGLDGRLVRYDLY